VIRNAKLWCDVESASQAKTLSKKWDYNLVPGFTASKILWLKENEPENFEQLAKVLLPHDYFNWYLTGRYCAEVSTPHQSQLQKFGSLADVSTRDVWTCAIIAAFMQRCQPVDEAAETADWHHLINFVKLCKLLAGWRCQWDRLLRHCRAML
jgi:sugar (pentulose or hexulose) kinase